MLGWPLKVTLNAANGFDWKFQHCGETNLKPEPVPAHLDYDFWLGPAPFKPYNEKRVHKKFRGYWDYDGGGLGDMGQHYLDPVQWFLGKDHTSPIEIEVDTYPQHPDAVLPWFRIEMKYADGCRIILDGESRDRGAPYVEGPEGKLYRGLESNIPNLSGKLASLPDPEPQMTDFVEAVRTRKRFVVNEDNGHRSCTLVNLGKVALRTGRSLRFDPERQEFIDDDEANRLIDQSMRSPWHL
jgi:predicted dehydrogenase